MATQEKYRAESVANDQITRSHFEINGFISSITGRQQTLLSLKEMLQQNGMMPSDTQKETPFTFSKENYSRLIDICAQNGFLAPAMQREIAANGKDGVIESVSANMRNVYNKLAAQNIQPIQPSDTRFNLLFSMLGTRRQYYARAVNGKPYAGAPFVAGDILLSGQENIKYEAVTGDNKAQLMIATDSLASDALNIDSVPDSVFMVTPFITTSEQMKNGRPELSNLTVEQIRQGRAAGRGGPIEIANNAKQYVENLRLKLLERSKNKAKNKASKNTKSAPPQNISREQALEFASDYNNAGINVNAKNKQQVSEFLGPFFTKSDLDYLNKSILTDKTSFSPEAMNRARVILEHLFDRGVEYEVSKNEKYPDQIVIKLADGKGTTVRVIDKNELYIGRVHAPMGDLYYADYNRKANNWSAEDTRALLDFVTGSNSVKGEIKPPKDGTTMDVVIPGTKRKAIYKPSETRLRSVIFEDAFAAKEAIDDYLETARNLYREQILDESTEGDQPEFVEIKENLHKELLDNETEMNEQLENSGVELSEDERTAIAKTFEEKREAIIDNYVLDGVGSYEAGFNPAQVVNLNSQVRPFNINDSLITALKYVQYDTEKLKGTEFGVNTIKDRMIIFDPKSAVSIENQTNPFLQKMQKHIQDELISLGVVGYDPKTRKVMPNSKPYVYLDENGIVQWSGYRLAGQRSKDTSEHVWQPVSTNIGQIFAPNERGIVETKFASGENYGFIPGYTGHFAYSDLQKGRMERFKGIGYEQIMLERLSATLREQVARPIGGFAKRIKLGMDSVGLNSVYHGEVYGQRIDLDWYDKSELPDEVKDKIIETTAGRIRFGNKYSEHATTFAALGIKETSTSENAFFETTDKLNMRILHEDLANYVDLVMTGTNKTQGLVWYKASGAEFTDDGSLIPAPEQFDKNGNPIYAKAPLRELDYFAYSDHNAWDRNQMAANQLMTAYHVDTCRSALMTFGGWTFDDSYVVSKEFADRNKVPDAETGELRPLKRGDKISDFGGNKGTIGLIVDRHMSAEDAKAKGLEKEVGIFRNNPDLDLVGSPYSMHSRHNASVIKEMQGKLFADERGNVSYRNVKPVLDENGKPLNGCESGYLNVIVTDMLTDKKSHAYTEEDLKLGKGRSVSSQLVWALNEHGAKNIVEETFGKNDSAWATYREYLIAVGYDMSADGRLRVGYEPHGAEVRHEFNVDPEVDSTKFMKRLLNKGGMLNLPFPVQLASGQSVSKLPILSAAARSNTELLDGEMKMHNYTKDYVQIYEAASEYMNVLKEKAEFEAETKVNPVPLEDYKKKMKTFNTKLAVDPKDINYNPQVSLAGLAQNSVGRIQDGIVMDKLGGYNGENSKYSHLRTKIMSKRAYNSATGVVTVNPQLPLDTVAVSPKIYETLKMNKKNKDELVAIWRDPALRDGAIRAMKVVVDEEISGVSIHPTVDKSFDADFDGDTFGIKKFHSKGAQEDLKNLLAMQHNLLDKGTEEDTTYLNISMDIVSGAVKAGIIPPYKPDIQVVTDEKGNPMKDENGKEITVDKGAGKPKKDLIDLVTDIAIKNTPQEAIRKTDEVMKKALSHNYGSARVRLSSKDALYESMLDISNDGAKGSTKSANGFMAYYEGKKTLDDARTIQNASGIKSDLTGVAGSFSQRLMAVMRDINPKVALEVTYVVSQGTLQIKHDAEKGEKLGVILNQDLQNLLDGRQRYAKPNGPEQDKFLSVETFKQEMRKIYNDELDVPLKEEHLEELATLLEDPSEPGRIAGMNKTKDRVASTLDRIAYNGGLSAIDKLAKENASFNQGKNSSLMLPEKMRNATPETILAKADTQNMELREAKEKELEAEHQKQLDDDPFGDHMFDGLPPTPPKSVEKPDKEVEKELEDDGLTL